jgi:hypothetical protein
MITLRAVATSCGRLHRRVGAGWTRTTSTTSGSVIGTGSWWVIGGCSSLAIPLAACRLGASGTSSTIAVACGRLPGSPDCARVGRFELRSTEVGSRPGSSPKRQRRRGGDITTVFRASVLSGRWTPLRRPVVLGWVSGGMGRLSGSAAPRRAMARATTPPRGRAQRPEAMVGQPPGHPRGELSSAWCPQTPIADLQPSEADLKKIL